MRHPFDGIIGAAQGPAAGPESELSRRSLLGRMLAAGAALFGLVARASAQGAGRPDGSPAPRPSTVFLVEEGGGGGPRPSSHVYYESGGPARPTTQRLGETGGQNRPRPTTQRTGEEGGRRPSSRPATLVIGEAGGSRS
jgi:hypothetical protein